MDNFSKLRIINGIWYWFGESPITGYGWHVMGKATDNAYRKDGQKLSPHTVAECISANILKVDPETGRPICTL